MSNRLYIEPTVFTNERTGIVTRGVRVYDDYFSSYDNTWNEIPDDDMEVLAKVIEDYPGGEIGDGLDFVQSNEKGIGIGDAWYSWDEIKHLFE